MNDKASALIYLISCAVNGSTPDRGWVSRMDSDGIFRLAKAHKTSAMAAFALEGVKDALAPEDWDKWRQAKELAVRRNLLFDAEREKLLAWMDARGIWYLPLKGILLKDFYPRYAMREMADNDILFDESCAEDLRDHMKAEGYFVKDFNEGVHDSYEKPPVFNFEFHRQLYNYEANSGIFETYYADVKDRAIHTEGTKCGCHFSVNDLYVYVTSHAFKHFDGRGTGLRTLADDYMMRKVKESELDSAYIAAEFEKLSISGFAGCLQSAADKLLAPVTGDDPEAEVGARIAALTEEEQKLLGYIVESGVYGTTDHFIEKRLREVDYEDGPLTPWVKIKFFFRWVFPPRWRMDTAVPFTKGRPWLLPIGYVYRMFRAAFARRQKISRELAAYRRIDSSRKQ